MHVYWKSVRFTIHNSEYLNHPTREKMRNPGVRCGGCTLLWYAIPAGSRILAPPDHTGPRICIPYILSISDDDDDDDSGGGSSCAEHSAPSWDKADPDFDDGTTTPMPIHANVTAAARSSRLSPALAPAADTVEQKHEVDKYDTHHGQQLQPLLDAVGLSHTPWRCDESIVTEGTWSCWRKGPSSRAWCEKSPKNSSRICASF